MRPRPAPRTADYAEGVIAEMKRYTKNKAARVRMAEMAIEMGNYTDEARKVWVAYLAEERA
jgi:hypothetical protein